MMADLQETCRCPHVGLPVLPVPVYTVFSQNTAVTVLLLRTRHPHSNEANGQQGEAI